MRATRTRVMRLLMVSCLSLAVIVGSPAVASGDGYWRGYKVVTVINPRAAGVTTEEVALPAPLSTLDNHLNCEPSSGLSNAPSASGANSEVAGQQSVDFSDADATARDGIVRVGVIDSGISRASGVVISAGRDYVTGDSYLADDSGHGTAVASIIAAAAPQAELVSLKVKAKGVLTTAEVTARAIQDAVDEFHCDILIMAFGQSDSPVLRQAVEHAYGKGALLIAAVGNEGASYKRNKVYYPAGYAQVVGVGSTDAAGAVSDFSQRGGVKVVACGEQVPALSLDGAATTVTGTSFAAAAVAGWAANSGLESGSAALTYLLGRAEDLGPSGYDPAFGYGLIDCGGEAE